MEMKKQSINQHDIDFLNYVLSKAKQIESAEVCRAVANLMNNCANLIDIFDEIEESEKTREEKYIENVKNLWRISRDK